MKQRDTQWLRRTVWSDLADSRAGSGRFDGNQAGTWRFTGTIRPVTQWRSKSAAAARMLHGEKQCAFIRRELAAAYFRTRRTLHELLHSAAHRPVERANETAIIALGLIAIRDDPEVATRVDFEIVGICKAAQYLRVGNA